MRIVGRAGLKWARVGSGRAHMCRTPWKSALNQRPPDSATIFQARHTWAQRASSAMFRCEKICTARTSHRSNNYLYELSSSISNPHIRSVWPGHSGLGRGRTGPDHTLILTLSGSEPTRSRCSRSPRPISSANCSRFSPRSRRYEYKQRSNCMQTEATTITTTNTRKHISKSKAIHNT